MMMTSRHESSSFQALRYYVIFIHLLGPSRLGTADQVYRHYALVIG